MNTKEMIAAAMFAALTAIFAQISIPLPFSPVPITLQVLAVCLAAAILGSKLGTLSQLLYVAIGAIGLPVFAAGTSGIQAIIGPRGGYIIGFVLGAFVIGKIVERKSPPTLPVTMAAMLAGVIVIYFAGMLQLSVVTGMDLKAAFLAGVAPFVGMDVIKIALGSYVAYSVRNVLIRQNLLTVR
ncbi:MAG: Substrate-specific component BioY of biotin ECF transporter [Firmicutes bacterium]|nr:Substrate-specific component BioY of biotin ECF transporter [Bacillota bacterium]